MPLSSDLFRFVLLFFLGVLPHSPFGVQDLNDFGCLFNVGTDHLFVSRDSIDRSHSLFEFTI